MSDPLFAFFTIKELTLRNRIVSTSHEPAYSEDGLPKDRYRAYHGKRRGGASADMIGGSALVSPDTRRRSATSSCWKDEAVPCLRKLTDEVHEQGAAVMTQLTHLGHRTSNYTHDWLPALSASDPRAGAPAFAKGRRAVGHGADPSDFVDAAQRCQEAVWTASRSGLRALPRLVLRPPFWNHRETSTAALGRTGCRYPLSGHLGRSAPRSRRLPHRGQA